MHTLLALLLFVVVFVVPNQVTAEDVEKDLGEKRQVSVLARNGHLPFTGKRYADEREQESNTSENRWESDQEPSVFLMNKRYVGALAKSGDLMKYKQVNDKRDDVDTLIDELLTAEELRRMRLEALREELLKQEEEDNSEIETDKRSLASLARSGSFPFREDKRSIASMARSGFMRGPSGFLSTDDYEKRGISSLARNGQLPYFGKRGGISSLMRNGFPNQKRSFDSELDTLPFDDYDVEDKRNVASLARGQGLPFNGKRNVASFARNGWLGDFRQNKKSDFFDWDDSMEESKRNMPSLLRNRLSPFSQGKRYLGSFVASNRLPYTATALQNPKRNVGAMARNWNLPSYGKRDWYDNEIGNDELANLYVSSLLNQEPERMGAPHDELDEQKRHIGSFLSQKSKSLVMRKKKSITPEDQLGEQPPTSLPPKPRTDENKMNNNVQQNQRQKREALADFTPDSDEYPMPVMQNIDTTDYEEGNFRSSVEEPTRKKRYFAVRGGGKIPGGRLPHVGRNRSNNPNSGRRRGGH